MISTFKQQFQARIKIQVGTTDDDNIDVELDNSNKDLEETSSSSVKNSNKGVHQI